MDGVEGTWKVDGLKGEAEVGLRPGDDVVELFWLRLSSLGANISWRALW